MPRKRKEKAPTPKEIDEAVIASSGIKHPDITDALARSHRKGYEPLDEVIDLARGNVASGGNANPYYGTIIKHLTYIERNLSTPLTDEKREELLATVQEYIRLAHKHMAHSYVPIEIRAKLMAKILDHTYPTYGRIESVNKNLNINMDIDQQTITQQEVDAVKNLLEEGDDT